MNDEISVRTQQHIEIKDITGEVQKYVANSGVKRGFCVVYCPHTTAGLVINENADPDVCSDLVRAFEAAVPRVRFDHAEGNSPSHFLSCITGSSLNLLIEDSHIKLGTWQGIFLCEFDGPRRRKVWVRVFGEV